MKLTEWLKRFPAVRLADPVNPAEQERILSFYNHKVMQGTGLSIASVRGPDFFELLRAQGPEFFVFLVEDDEGKLYCMSSLSIRKGYVNGKVESVGYWGDFRLARRSGKKRFWQDFMRALVCDLSAIDELRDIRLIYCALIDENRVAKRALFGARTEDGFQFERVVPYQMVNLLKRKPWKPKRTLSALHEVLRLTIRDSALRKFLNEGQAKLPLGYAYDAETIAYRTKKWPNYQDSLFWVLREKATSRILACFLIWSPDHMKYNRVDRLPRSLRLVARALRLPGEGERLKVGYLTHLDLHGLSDRAARGQALELLLQFASSEQKGRFHFLSFCDYRDHSLLPELGQWWIQKVPMSLYQIAGPGRVVKLSPDAVSDGVGFEMALV